MEAAARAELTRLAGLLVRPEMALRLLADRLEETGGEALVDRPFPWLMRRGLVQRQACSDHRCDDGIRLDTGGECENCGNVVHIRRARRAKIAAQIDRELPGLSAPLCDQLSGSGPVGSAAGGDADRRRAIAGR